MFADAERLFDFLNDLLSDEESELEELGELQYQEQYPPVSTSTQEAMKSEKFERAFVVECKG
jgi:hypothetical protein